MKTLRYFLLSLSIQNELICSQMFSSNMLKQSLSQRLFLGGGRQGDYEMALTINIMANGAL